MLTVLHSVQNRESMIKLLRIVVKISFDNKITANDGTTLKQDCDVDLKTMQIRTPFVSIVSLAMPYTSLNKKIK